MNNTKKFKNFKKIVNNIVEIFKKDNFNNFNCISALNKKIANLLKDMYMLEDKKEIDNFITKTYKDTLYFDFINTNFTIIKFYLYWLHFCIQHEEKKLFNKLLIVYACITYYRIFKNMLPYCNNIKLDFARKNQRKDSYFYNNETHYLLVTAIVNSLLENFSYKEEEIYKLLINITNTIRQSLRKLISTYINMEKENKSNQSEYIDGEELLKYIENSLVVVENEIVEKISKKRKLNANILLRILADLNNKRDKILPTFLIELNKNPILRKKNILSSYYWSKVMIEKMKNNNLLLEILKKNKIIDVTTYLYIIFEYFRNYIIMFI